MHRLLLIFLMKEMKFEGKNSKYFNFFLWRSNHRWCSIKKGVLKNFKKFTRKHMCWNVLFLITLQSWGLYEKRDSNSVFFLFILRNFLYIFPLSDCCYLWKELKIAYIVESLVNMTVQQKRKTYSWLIYYSDS